MSAKDWFSDFARGMALGAGILPGVSVGTVGLIVNVYDRLIDAISDLTKHFWSAVKRLLPLALGCILCAAILLLGYSRLKAYIPFEIISIFAGLTLGGTPVIIKRIDWKGIRPMDIVRIAIGFIIAAGLGVLTVIASKNNWFDIAAAFENPNENFWVYILTFIAGFIAAVACLLPGISGSMVLFVFGLYAPVVGLYTGENSMLHNHDRIGTGIILTIVLLIGILLGFVSFAKIMKKLEKDYHQGTFTMVLGFVLGSVVSIFINNDIWEYYESSPDWWHFLIGAVLFLAGCIGLALLIKKTSDTPTNIPEIAEEGKEEPIESQDSSENA